MPSKRDTEPFRIHEIRKDFTRLENLESIEIP